MMKAIPEREWKLLRSMKDAKVNQILNRYLINSIIFDKGNKTRNMSADIL